MLFSILLMLWVGYTSAGACNFDSSCTCTSSAPQLGQVQCHNGPVTLPYLNSSKLFTLSLVNNDLDELEPNLLQGTGLYKLEISRNPLYSLHEESLSGLERTLWELHVTYCRLSNVPGNALRHLYKLKTLNLTGNEIMTINSDQLRGVSMSLQTLILANNALTVLPAGVFGSLQHLEVLDLTGNSIASFNPATFTPAPPKLVKIILSDNLFEDVPYKELSGIRSLRILDMSYNLISRIGDGAPGGRLTLESIYFDHNQITQLGPSAMAHFEVANKTSFRANPITDIEPNAFRGCRITELILADCRLANIDPEAFNDLENSLNHLDLSGNNITAFSYNFIMRYPALRTLKLNYNYITNFEPLEESSKEMNDKNLPLLHFEIAGKTNAPFNLQTFYRMGHLQSLSLSRPHQSSLSPDDLLQFSVELETLKIIDGGITSLSPNMFKHTRGIKTLDLTDNNIDSIDSKTFVELGHSLENLIMTHSFGRKISNFPGGFLRPLNSLRVLKMNHNGLKTFPQDISKLPNLRILHAHDNNFESLSENVFEEDVHTKLEEINLAFNKIPKLKTGTFADLRKLRNIYLSDNALSQIDRGAFANLVELNNLWLRGNKLNNLPVEAFQNLPHLDYLDLAYNSLRGFNFASLEQVGMLSELVVNCSHNSMSSLLVNASTHGKDIVYTNIKVLDFSYNNMSYIDPGYLEPVQHSLTHLHLSHNAFMNTSRYILPEMLHLQYLDFSHNLISDLEFDTLRGARNLQVVNFAHNRLQDIPERIFASLNYLRRIDFSHNFITQLKDATISTPHIVKLDLSHNLLTRAPLTIFTPSAASCLMELDISNNKIGVLPSADSFGRFNSLRRLDLSNNRLSDIGNTFSQLPHLEILSLANNYIHIGGKDFSGLEHTLRHLDLTNISATYVPSLPLPSLLTLKISYNSLSYLPPDMATNLTNLKHLDISYNELQVVPSFPQLKSLNIAGNQISTISNSSFKNFHRLMELNIQDLPIKEFDDEALEDLSVVQYLHISNYKQIPQFNIPKYIEKNKSIRTLCLRATDSSNLGNEMKGLLPYKVRNIVLTGREMKSVSDQILQGVRYPSLKLTLYNTSIESLPYNMFTSLPYVRNITMELRNNTLRSISNPSNTGAMNTPRKTFLTDLDMDGNQWNCDCQLGWIETWQRKMRQYNFDFETIENSRENFCKNKQNKPLLSILKTDLECGWSSGHLTVPVAFTVFFVTIVPHLIFSLIKFY